MNFLIRLKEKIEIIVVKLNRAYGRVKEPNKFIIFLLLATSGLSTMAFGQLIEHMGVVILGYIWIIFLLSVRWWFLFSLAKKYPNAGKKK